MINFLRELVPPEEHLHHVGRAIIFSFSTVLYRFIAIEKSAFIISPQLCQITNYLLIIRSSNSSSAFRSDDKFATINYVSIAGPTNWWNIHDKHQSEQHLHRTTGVTVHSTNINHKIRFNNDDNLRFGSRLFTGKHSVEPNGVWILAWNGLPTTM